MMSPHELQASAALTLAERVKRIREVHQIQLHPTHLRYLYKKMGIHYQTVNASMVKKI